MRRALAHAVDRQALTKLSYTNSLAFTAQSPLPPALGVPLVFLLINYLADAIGSLWPDASWLRDWSSRTKRSSART